MPMNLTNLLEGNEYNTTMLTPFLDNTDENGHSYLGLDNQSNTCYLNSLIQTLYMTPELRNAVYK